MKRVSAFRCLKKSCDGESMRIAVAEENRNEIRIVDK